MGQSESTRPEDQVPWYEELESRATKIHVLACKVAIVAVPAFFVTDFLIAPEYWRSFLFLRLLVSLIVGILLLSRRWINVWDTMLAFIPFISISLLNAYMWSVMDVKGFQMHSFSYMALFIAGGMLLLWRSHYTMKVVGLSIVFNLIFFPLFSDLTFSEIMTNGGALTLAVAIFSVILMNTRYRLTKDEIISRLLLKQSKEELEEKNQEITDSITYAKRIQQALLPPEHRFQTALPNGWVFYQPKDIVAGDFYLLEKKNDFVFFAAADCTGHGVPGAMVSVVCSNALQRAINELGITEPAKILDAVREMVVETFERSDMNVKDGMDIALCRLDANNKLAFSGANNPLYHVRKKKGELGEKDLYNDSWMLEEYKGDKQPIGKFSQAKAFSQTEVQLQPGDQVFISTDGFPDQFGGPKGKKYLYKNFKKLFLSIADLSVEDQRKRIEIELADWMKEEKQIDDVCVMGVRISNY